MDLAKRMDPEIAAVLGNFPVLDLSDIPAARQAHMARRAVANAGVAPSPTVIRQDHFVPGRGGAPDVRVRHYRPASQSGVLPCLYWIHSGGHVLGQIEQDDVAMDRLVDSVGCAVVSVDWRRPPEHPFPAPMDDCYAGLAWTYRTAAELGIDPGRIAVGGASSGGGSAAGLALLARDHGELPVCFQLLIYPMLDDRNVTPASVALTDPRVWNRTSNQIGWHAYLGDAVGTGQVSPYAAPTRATDLSGLPPPTWPWVIWICSSTRTWSTPSDCSRPMSRSSCMSTRAPSTASTVPFPPRPWPAISSATATTPCAAPCSSSSGKPGRPLGLTVPSPP